MTSPEERPGEQGTDFLAKLFDIRSFTGALFLIFGVIVTIVGLTASDADINKSAGLNLALISGRSCLPWARSSSSGCCSGRRSCCTATRSPRRTCPNNSAITASKPSPNTPANPAPSRRLRDAGPADTDRSGGSLPLSIFGG